MDWLDQFEQVSYSLSDQQKKKLLAIALVDSARAWFRDDLEPQIENLSWDAAKKRIIDSYNPSKEQHYVEKLGKMSFTWDKFENLGAYVDQRIHLARKAYPRMSDSEIIRDTIISMPPSIRSKLNLMSDTQNLAAVEDFKKLVSRFDNQIDVESDRQAGSNLDKATFEKLLQQAVEKVVASSQKQEAQILAAVRTKESNQNSRSSEPERPEKLCRNCSNQRYNQYRQRPQYRPRYQAQRQPVGQTHPAETAAKEGAHNPANNSQRQPPSPCRYCQGGVVSFRHPSLFFHNAHV